MLEAHEIIGIAMVLAGCGALLAWAQIRASDRETPQLYDPQLAESGAWRHGQVPRPPRRRRRNSF